MSRWYDEVFEDKVRFGVRVERRVHAQRSALQHIEVLDTVPFGRTLVIDGIFMASEQDEHYYHEMITHPALVTAPAIRRVLVIGGGDGGTAREVLRHRGVEEVVQVEIDGAVIDVCKRFLPGLGAWDDPRLDVIVGDGVAYVKEARVEPFDVVILDGTDPVGPGKGLFDIDFYRGVKRVLAPGGVFALQSESPAMMRNVFLAIQRALAQVFTRVKPYFGPAPLYASGVWSWTHATDRADAHAVDPGRLEAIEPGCKYYNRDIHQAAFALPSDLRRELGEPLGKPLRNPT